MSMSELLAQNIVPYQAQAISKDAALAGGIWADMGTGSGALAIGLAKCMTGTGQVRHLSLFMCRCEDQDCLCSMKHM